MEVCRDPVLQDLPYKVQTDKWGNILMSPATNEHGILQARIASLIERSAPNGIVISECSIQTVDGVKVADIAFASHEFIRSNRGDTPYKRAPEICVGILSYSNTRGEREEKNADISRREQERYGFVLWKEFSRFTYLAGR